MESNQKYLFTSDSKGVIKQWNFLTRKLHKDWGKIHKHPIYSIKATIDLQNLFTSDINGCLKQHSIESGNLVKDYKKIHSGLIQTLETTPDNLYLFTCHPNMVERYTLKTQNPHFKNKIFFIFFMDFFSELIQISLILWKNYI